MEDDVFRWVLLALGTCIIVAVAAHGIWTSRKNSKHQAEQHSLANRAKKQQFQPGGWQQDDWQDEQSDSEGLTAGAARDEAFSIKIDTDQDELNAAITAKRGAAEFDDLGLGAVRVVGANSHASKTSGLADESDELPSLADFEPSDKLKTPEPKPVSSGKVYASVVTQPKPEYAARYASQANSVKPTASVTPLNKPADSYQAPEPPPFLLKSDDKPVSPRSEVNIDALKATAQAAVAEPTNDNNKPKVADKPAEKVSLAEQARNLVMGKKADIAAKRRREPKIAEDQMRIDFDDEQMDSKPANTAASEPKTADVAQEVLVLNVKTAENAPISGAALLPMLLTLGFKFGDQDIFHRHVNSNGKGPVLFSLANMFKPGNFDIDNLENFSTQGLSLFMILPIEGDPHQVFNMMHNAARKIADEFSAQVYDGRRALLTKQSLQQYVEKIREFERKRMVTR